MIASGVLAAYGITYFSFFRSKSYDTHAASLDALFLILVFGGIVGARALFVLYHLPYFFEYPFEIPAIWHGGWVWHGALLGGGVALFVYTRIKRVSFLLLADLIVPGVALAQGIGRWGNYFNQEAYGMPTFLPWGISIDPENRVAGYETFTHFHPTFFYESVWDMLLFALLFTLARRWFHGNGASHRTGTIFALYLIFYSIGRFAVELLRIDIVPAFAGLRIPQLISIILMAAGLFLLLQKQKRVV